MRYSERQRQFKKYLDKLHELKQLIKADQKDLLTTHNDPDNIADSIKELQGIYNRINILVNDIQEGNE